MVCKAADIHNTELSYRNGDCVVRNLPWQGPTPNWDGISNQIAYNSWTILVNYFPLANFWYRFHLCIRLCVYNMVVKYKTRKAIQFSIVSRYTNKVIICISGIIIVIITAVRRIIFSRCTHKKCILLLSIIMTRSTLPHYHLYPSPLQWLV